MLGVFSILLVVTAAYAQGYVSDRLVISGNAAATAANILAHHGLFMSAFSRPLDPRMKTAARASLSANVDETPAPWKFSIEGETRNEDVHDN